MPHCYSIPFNKTQSWWVSSAFFVCVYVKYKRVSKTNPSIYGSCLFLSAYQVILLAVSYPSCRFSLSHGLLNKPTSLSPCKESFTQAHFPQLLLCPSPALHSQTSSKTCLHTPISSSHLPVTLHPLQYDLYPLYSTK